MAAALYLFPLSLTIACTEKNPGLLHTCKKQDKPVHKILKRTWTCVNLGVKQQPLTRLINLTKDRKDRVKWVSVISIC